jgi:bifunctional DNase/RNase
MTVQIDRLQQQMLKAITGISDLAVISDLHTNQLLRPNAYLNPKQALAIYQRAYIARLLDCLREDFPILRQHLGDQLFDHFAIEYMNTFPPKSYSLFDLGEHFPLYLQQSCPEIRLLDQQEQMLYMLPIEIATAERLHIRAMRAQGTEQRSWIEPDYHDLQQLRTISVRISDACGVMMARTNLLDVLNRGTGNQIHTGADADRTYLAIGRSHYHVSFDLIQDWQYHFLSTLIQKKDSGFFLANLVIEVNEKLNIDTNYLYARLALWLPVAISRGYLFVEITNSESTKPVSS